MIIDAHVHYTPPDMVTNLKDFSEQEPYWGLLITPNPVNHTEQGWATVDRMISDMDRQGVDKVILLTVYRNNPEGCKLANDETIKIIKQFPDRVKGFCVFHPRSVDQAIDEIKRCVDEGMVGVGELNPYGQGLRPDTPEFLKVVEFISDIGLPLNLHVSEEVGHYYLGKTTTPLIQYYELACRFPDLKLILAHWGGGLLFFEIMPEVKKDLKNVYYDMAGSPLLYPTEKIFQLALNATDHRKILYGSDYPLLIKPEMQNEPDFSPFIEEIRSLELPESIYNNIMGLNTAHLMGWIQSHEQIEGTEKPDNSSKQIDEVGDQIENISEYMSVAEVARIWPNTQTVFEKYGIPSVDTTVPFWEPIIQAAATHGLGPEKRVLLLQELQEAAGL